MKKLLAPLFIAALFAFPASAQAESFFIDSRYDEQGKASLNASQQYFGENSRWFVEDRYWNRLSSLERSNLRADIIKLSDEFDDIIYPQLTALFGSENNPGVDNDGKITVLVTEMIEEAGGYMREQDGLAKSVVANSNEREMLYLNAAHIDDRRAKAFLAHEFQHVITFNQKYIEHGVQEEVWLNELRSEIASTILGYDDPALYGGSNLEARVKKFLETPSDALLDWGNNSNDYATINVFGQYLLDHYGRSFLAAMIQNDKVGLASFHEGLAAFGFKEDFAKIYKNWVLAALINNCEVGPKYCYKNSNLEFDDFHIQFNSPKGSGEEITSQTFVGDWQADWLKLEKKLETDKPADHIFMLQFFGGLGSKFSVPYVVYDKDRKTILEIGEMEFDENGDGIFYVENFGYTVAKIVIIPYNRVQEVGTVGSVSETGYIFNASTIDDAEYKTRVAPPSTALAETESATSTDVRLPNLPNGSLIRAEGDYKVYIINQGYKRWIQSAEIFDFYGHLNFAVVNVLPPEQVALYKDSWLVRADGDPKVYEINGDGTRHWLDISADEFNASGRKWDMVYVINEAELAWYEEGASVK